MPRKDFATKAPAAEQDPIEFTLDGLLFRCADTFPPEAIVPFEGLPDIGRDADAPGYEEAVRASLAAAIQFLAAVVDDPETLWRLIAAGTVTDDLIGEVFSYVAGEYETRIRATRRTPVALPEMGEWPTSHKPTTTPDQIVDLALKGVGELGE